MIMNENYKEISAKEKAKDILLAQVTFCWQDYVSESELEAMTDKEQEDITDNIITILTKITKKYLKS